MEVELQALLSKEEPNPLAMPPEIRRKIVDWVVRVNTYYSFSPLTTVLAVNYIDRFLYIHYQGEKPWITQLAATACLSLAAKLEETLAPSPVDLQVEDAKYIFEHKTIQRMEMLILSTLQWRMNPVTPLSFLDYIATHLGLNSDLISEFQSVLISIISDWRISLYSPSVLAMAILLEIGGVLNSGSDFEDLMSEIVEVDKVKVEECQEMIVELAEGWPRLKKRKGYEPGSPIAVIEASFSSDWSSSPN